MKLGNVIQCLGCGATNRFLLGQDVTCCSYCGNFLEREYSSENVNSHINDEQNRKEMFEAILNDSLVRSVFLPKKPPLYIQLPMSFYNAFGLKGIAAVAFGLFVLFHSI